MIAELQLRHSPTTYPVVFQSLTQIFSQGAPEDQIICQLTAGGCWGYQGVRNDSSSRFRSSCAPQGLPLLSCILHPICPFVACIWEPVGGRSAPTDKSMVVFQILMCLQLFMFTLHGLLPVPQDSLSPVFKFHHHTITLVSLLTVPFILGRFHQCL